MRYLFYQTILILFLFIGTASAQILVCPEPSDAALSVQGPRVKTNMKNITVAVCRYFEDQRLVGLVTVKYAQAYKFGQDLCKTPSFMEASLRAEDTQAYADIKDVKQNDDYTIGYWEEIGVRLLDQVQELALTCSSDKKMFRRPLDIRKSFKNR